MRLPRYIAILGERDPFGIKRALRERMAAAGLFPAFSAPAIELFCNRSAPLRLDGEAGIILGAIYRRDAAMSDLECLDADQSGRIVASRGQRLIDGHWGDYVAFLNAGAECLVLRPPFSDLGCVTARLRGVLLAASDLALLELCGAPAQEPDWRAIAAHLHTNGLRENATCISGVEELLWGERLVVRDGTARVEPCWSPWDFAQKPRQASPVELARELHERALACVAAQVRRQNHVAVMLSGGLDSSILAACVAQTPTRLTCLNLPFGDSAGDERAYARSVAARLGVPLFEVEPDVGDVDVLQSGARGLARPIARSFLQAARLAKQRVAAAAGATAVLDGGGGDNLFCSLQSVAPVADRLLREGLGLGAFRTARDVAQLTQASLPRVLGRALSRAGLRRPAYRWRVDTRFLSGAAIERAGAPVHRWLEPPHGALPGSAAHIALMIVVESLLETVNGEVPEWAPLMAQPLVEFCLSVPSWHWFEGGHNRAVARRAFEEHLPGEIAWRRGKGSPDGFVAQLFEANRGKLGDLLVDGLLCEHGIVDREALRPLLASEHPVKGHDYVRLLKLADVEAWVRDLTTRAHASPPPSASPRQGA